jgi:dual-specificity kinase
MSTPSTLPPHHPNYGYPHHQAYQSTGAYRANNNLLNGGNRLGASYNFPAPSSNDTSSNSIIATDPSRTSQNATQNSARSSNRAENMPPTSSAAMSKPQNARKRQRSREPRKPDWKKFYEKGLPQEVIIIDDSPTPDPSEPLISHTHHDSGRESRQPQKKRKRNDVGNAYDPIYGHSRSINHTPDYKNSAGSTISTDRTTSANHTTAATSLGSHSSNGQNGYQATDVQPGQKRKRTATRLQLANEKRRELEVNGDPFTNYKPPPNPPVKASDVHVKVVPDVRLQQHMNSLG